MNDKKENELIAKYNDKAKYLNSITLILIIVLLIAMIIAQVNFIYLVFSQLNRELFEKIFVVVINSIIIGIIIYISITNVPLVNLSILNSKIILSRGLIRFPKYIIAKKDIISVSGKEVTINKSNEELNFAANRKIMLIGNKDENRLWIITRGRTFIISCPDAINVATKIREVYSLENK